MGEGLPLLQYIPCSLGSDCSLQLRPIHPHLEVPILHHSLANSINSLSVFDDLRLPSGFKQEAVTLSVLVLAEISVVSLGSRISSIPSLPFSISCCLAAAAKINVVTDTSNKSCCFHLAYTPLPLLFFVAVQLH